MVVIFLIDIHTSCRSTEQLIQKLAGFMGVPLSQNPDESYVLTVDNFIKILAIQMRFRFGFRRFAFFSFIYCNCNILIVLGVVSLLL